MKQIVIPEELTLSQQTPTGETQEIQYSFAEFVLGLMNLDERFNADLPGVRAAVKIEALVKDKRAGETLDLEDADWQRLKEAAESPTGRRYPISPARRIANFLEVIVAAK